VRGVKAGTLVRSAVGLAAGTAVILLDGRAALADESYFQLKSLDHTFISTGNEPVRCQITSTSSLDRPPGSASYLGGATTSVDTSNDACRGFVSVDVTYADPNGVEKSSGAFGAETFARWHGNDVGTDFEAFHRVFFFECVEHCEFTVTTRPK
jgi:hypothetical protein